MAHFVIESLLLIDDWVCIGGGNGVGGVMANLVIENIVSMNGEVAIAWGDGEESYLGLEALRKACPCASCQGEPDVTGLVIRPPVMYGARSFELVKMEVVGGYAVSFGWADGHSTGIYSFEYLRSLGA